MKKILVPTDFSPASKTGVKFAIQWASQQEIELVFIHVLHLLIPTRWTRATAAAYSAGEKEACNLRFSKFINENYKKMNRKPKKFSTVIIQDYDPAKSILEYCKKDKSIDGICMSTNGAGSIIKLFGTNTSTLISKSPIPVLAIPKNYKSSTISHLLYATDFRNFKEELGKVLEFASSFRASVDIVHFSIPGQLPFAQEDIKKLSGEYEYGLNVIVDENNLSESLVEKLQKTIAKRKPSVVVMFTNQERNLFQKIFLSSKAGELSFQLKRPLLVYRKMKVKQKSQPGKKASLEEV